MDKIMVIAGPTATGKTAMALQYAKERDAEIISADSVQIYKGLDIGSAKIMPEEMQGIPHHLIDAVSPFEEYSVFDYSKAAKICIQDILKRGKTPIVVGGTGFYIHSVLYDMDFGSVKPDQKLREELNHLARNQGADVLYQRLESLNPQMAQNVHKNNVKRVIRAIEIASSCDTPKNFGEFEQRVLPNYDVEMYVLNMDRTSLYERINRRVDIMLEQGLIEEVRNLVSQGLDRSYQSMNSIGYKELIAYFDGEMTLDEAIELIKQKSRNYAKRQLTWFKKYEFANRLDVGIK